MNTKKDAEAVLRDMAPLIKTISNAANINDEMGRVVIGQAEAARKLRAILDAWQAN